MPQTIKSVLIADDDPVVRSMMLAYLGARGLRVMVAQDSMQASMVSLRDPSPDIVLLDIKMPGGSGMEVLRRVRNSSKTAAMPVIVVSADTNPNLPVEARIAGANDFMAKPLDLENLYHKICELLNIPPRN
jgi:DNA-binding response OmpR family regulator